MSHPIISSAVRQLSRPCSARATFSAISSPLPTPSFSAPFCHSSQRTVTISSAPKRAPRARSTVQRYPQSYLNTAQCSAFSSAAAKSAAQITQNPRVGEDGNNLMIGISERAASVRPTCPFILCVRLESPSWVESTGFSGVGTYFSPGVARTAVMPE
ncbi:hypothetical protein BDW59DRAFT_46680 [Aspergillus cavernicola]|uniref:Uncharacterized protein n=1 Tax=Aspergillus cavernicola TaxID=176166 RepID=A0ABR4J2U1_9EURO